jgi:gliding motility-associated-like protein
LFGQEVIVPETQVEFRPLYPCETCTYSWDFGDGGSSDVLFPKHQYRTAGKYTVALHVVSSNGCTSNDTVVDAVYAVDKTILRAPTAFSPSKYGPNGGMQSNPTDTKVFYPFTQGVVKFKMLIFNRWGQLIYQSTEVGRGWDGYHQGSIAPSDTYVYRIEATFNNGEARTLVGDVTLLH